MTSQGASGQARDDPAPARSQSLGHHSRVIAPRELTDVVYRCARTAGVHAGDAKALAARWTEAAIAGTGADAVTIARTGLEISQAAFDCLTRAAEAFLVSEQLLDQIVES